MFQFNARLNYGFTLMELLVSISIIAILAAVASVSYILMQKQIRDSRRASDLKAVQSAFEQYFVDNRNSYPSTCPLSLTPFPTYMPVGIPQDPKNTGDYIYTAYNCSTIDYCYCAKLEATQKRGNATDANCTFGDGRYFCVKNLQ